MGWFDQFTGTPEITSPGGNPFAARAALDRFLATLTPEQRAQFANPSPALLEPTTPDAVPGRVPVSAQPRTSPGMAGPALPGSQQTVPVQGGNEKAILAQFQQGIDPRDPQAVQKLAQRLQQAGYNVEVQGDRIRFPGSQFGWIDVLRNKTYLQGGADNRAWVFQPYHSKEDQARLGNLPGGSAGGSLASLGAGGDRMAALAQTPGYQFRLGEGIKALDRSAAAKGTLLTGGHLKDLTGFAQGLASTEFQNEFGRNFSLANLGMGAAGAQGQFGSSYGQNATNLITGAGNAQAAGTAAGGQAWGNALGTLGNLGMQAAMLYGLYGGTPQTANPYAMAPVPNPFLA